MNHFDRSGDILSILGTDDGRRIIAIVQVKGTFTLLDEARQQRGVQQFILASGDAALGIFYYPQPVPLDENAPLAAYPGYYAFSKVMEEVMVGQYHIQYGLPTTILRISWILA